jgi:hypothetical protein
VLAQPPFQLNETELAIVGTPTAAEIKAKLPANPALFPAGYYKLRVKVHKEPEVFDRSTNTLVLAVAPKISAPSLPHTVSPDGQGDVTLNIAAEPQVLPEQHAALLLGELEVVAKARAQKTDPLVFEIKNAPLGEHLVRLRVDGVDSLFVDTTKTPPVFDKNQTVKIT